MVEQNFLINAVYKLKSLVDFIFLLTFRLLYWGRSKSQNTLFINTGNIGDLIISGKILEVLGNSENDENYYFLVNEKQLELFHNYNGKVRLLGLDVTAFKYNLIYRIGFLTELKNKNIGTVYNLTSVRTTWNDILALAIGATNVYCYENTWKTLIKVFPKKTDSFYTDFVSKNIFNEYDRIEHLIKNISSTQQKQVNLFNNQKSVKKYEIIISPFSFDGNRDLGNEFIKEITEYFNDKSILILGSTEQKKKILLPLGKNVFLSFGKFKLNELYSLINGAKIFIGIDSGLTHIAIKTNAKVIAIIGSGNYGRYLPKPNDNRTVYFYDKCEFMGCEWHCKKDKVYCVENVSPQKVIGEINKILLHNENT